MGIKPIRLDAWSWWVWNWGKTWYGLVRLVEMLGLVGLELQLHPA